MTAARRAPTSLGSSDCAHARDRRARLAHARHPAAAGGGAPEAGALAGDEEVAFGRELEPARPAHAVPRSDQWLGDRGPRRRRRAVARALQRATGRADLLEV